MNTALKRRIHFGVWLALILAVFAIAAGAQTARPSKTAKKTKGPTAARVEPEFIGTWRPDGSYKEASKGDTIKERLNRRAVRDRQARPPEVPPSVNLHSAERLVENFEPPARATKVAQRPSTLRNVSDDIVTFVYGHEQVLLAPTHVTTDSHHRVIVTDPAHPGVHVLNGKDSFRIVGGSQHRLVQPAGVAVDAADNIYVADESKGMVLVFDPQGQFVRYLGTIKGEPMFAHPTGIALDRKAGRLYVLDTPSDELFVLDLRDNLVKRVGDRRDKTRPVNFDQPTEIALSSNKLVVMDSAGARIQILDLDCNLLGSFSPGQVSGPPLGGEMGLALDSAGNIYVTNLGFSNVRVYRQDGKFLGAFGQPGTMGAWVDESDRIFAADTVNSRVLVYGPAKDLFAAR